MRSKKQLVSPESAALAIDKMKLQLPFQLRVTRSRQGLTQSDLADHLGSSQSRVSKMEAGEPSVSLDLLFQGLLAVGLTASDIGRILDVDQRR
jgi:transcriptional regulator with XRE-family HTH domain